MAARKVQLKDNSGNKAYPVTSSACVGMSDGSGSLDSHISKITTEYNVSLFHPTEGIDGGNKYTLGTAIAKVPAKLRRLGMVVSFIDSNGEFQRYTFLGGTFASDSDLYWKNNADYEDIYKEALNRVDNFKAKCYINKQGEEAVFNGLCYYEFNYSNGDEIQVTGAQSGALYDMYNFFNGNTFISSSNDLNSIPSNCTLIKVNAPYPDGATIIINGKGINYKSDITNLYNQVKDIQENAVSLEKLSDKLSEYDNQYLKNRLVVLEGKAINNNLGNNRVYTTYALYITDDIVQLLIEGTISPNTYAVAYSDSLEQNTLTFMHTRNTGITQVGINIDASLFRGKYILWSVNNTEHTTVSVTKIVFNRLTNSNENKNDIFVIFPFSKHLISALLPQTSYLENGRGLKIAITNGTNVVSQNLLYNKYIKKDNTKYRLFFKIKATKMNIEMLRFQINRGSFNSMKIYELSIADLNKEKSFLSEEAVLSNSEYVNIFINASQLDHDQGKGSFVTNNTANTRINGSDDTVVEFEIYDIKLIEYDYSAFGHELATNCIIDAFEDLKKSDIIPIRDTYFAKKEITIGIEGDSMTVNSIWDDNYLFINNIKYIKTGSNTNQGHISNKTINSKPSTSYTAGFVDKIIKGSVTFDNQDVIIIQLGTHDYAQNSQGHNYCLLGEVGKLIDTDPNYPRQEVYDMFTVAGAMEAILQKVSHDNPNSRIVWIPTAYRLGENSNGYSIQDENELMRKVCRKWGVPVVDIESIGINQSNMIGKQLWDGGYEDNKRVGDDGNLIDDNGYFVTSFITTNGVLEFNLNAVKNYYVSAYTDSGFIRNNANTWNIVPADTTRIRVSIPKSSSTIDESAITNSPTSLVVSSLEYAKSSDGVHVPYAQDRYAKAVESTINNLFFR